MGSAERGSSLVGLLLVVIILGVVAATAVAATSAFTSGGGASAVLTQAGVSNPVANPLVPRTPAIDAVRQALCRANYQSVLSADEVLFAQTGAYAASVPQLVTAGLLHMPSSATTGYTLALELKHGAPTGEVTINGAAGPGRCGSI